MRSGIHLRVNSPPGCALLLAVCLMGGLAWAPRVGDAKPAPLTPVPLNPADTLAYSVEPYPYRIAPGDRLDVDFGLLLDKTRIQAETVVRPDGMATFPRVGDVRMAGLSTVEADTVLARLYEDVYVNPAITVAVREIAGNLVHVLGDVQRPGSYPMTPNASALQAIAAAGGFMTTAQPGDVVVLRRTNANQVAFKRVNLKALFSGKQGAQDIMLRRFDIVYVNRNTISNISLFLDQTLKPLLNMGTLYITGWEVFNIDRVFPNQVRTDLTP